MTDQPRAIYYAGYRAFEKGNYSSAVELATHCIAAAEANSYWHHGAVGLRCWAANFMQNDASVVHDAQTLLNVDAGSQTLWFQALAHLNLGLVDRRLDQDASAKAHFLQAEQCYTTYELLPDQPEEWVYVKRFFAAVAGWAARGTDDDLAILLSDLDDLDADAPDHHALRRALEIYMRCADSTEAREETLRAAADGVSRTFLAVLLI